MSLIDIKGHISTVLVRHQDMATIEITVPTGYMQASAITFEVQAKKGEVSALALLVGKTVRMTIDVEDA